MKETQLIDVDLFQKVVDESGYKESHIFEQLNMTRQAWIDKKKGRVPFRVPEVFMLCHILNITDDDLKTKIFYPEK